MHTHLVSSGQTLAEIGEMYGVSVNEMLAYNPFITNPNKIYAGQLLTIPPSMKVKLPSGSVVPFHSAWKHMMKSMMSMSGMPMSVPPKHSYMQMNPHLQVNPYLQMNPYFQVNPATQINPNVEVDPNIQVNPQTQVNPYVNISPALDFDLSIGGKRRPNR